MRTQSVLFPNYFFDTVLNNAPRADRTHSYVDENENGYLIQLDAPGVRREDVKISAEQRQLVIEAERKGRNAGTIRRLFSLPDDVNLDGVEAQMQDGVLEIKLPKKEQAKPKFIQVGEAKKSFFELSQREEAAK